MFLLVPLTFPAVSVNVISVFVRLRYENTVGREVITDVTPNVAASTGRMLKSRGSAVVLPLALRTYTVQVTFWSVATFDGVHAMLETSVGKSTTLIVEVDSATPPKFAFWMTVPNDGDVGMVLVAV